MNRVEVWGKGIAAAAIAGAANGMTTGLAAVGIDPGRFNLLCNRDCDRPWRSRGLAR
jgi:hypothetical protein